MEPCPRGGAGPGDIARILRDLRFHQNDIEQRITPQDPFYSQSEIIVPHFTKNFNQNYVKNENFARDLRQIPPYQGPADFGVFLLRLRTKRRALPP